MEEPPTDSPKVKDRTVLSQNNNMISACSNLNVVGPELLLIFRRGKLIPWCNIVKDIFGLLDSIM